TKADIAFLQSKIAGHPTASNITDPSFRNVSIITGLNIHKDEYNRIGAIQFAEKTGQDLVSFYSDDRMSSSMDDARCLACGRGNRSTIQSVTGCLHDMLWSASPSANNKQIPPISTLCKGMPIMIRSNSAMELCITKGQEGTVYAWIEGVGPFRKPMLEVLFVSLMSPPSEVRLPGLPPNIVPIVKTASTVVCSLPDDTTIKISRTQV
ncbi:hypothetical protein ARMGADRAFT_888868, partial [Armillaria gallica]